MNTDRCTEAKNTFQEGIPLNFVQVLSIILSWKILISLKNLLLALKANSLRNISQKVKDALLHLFVCSEAVEQIKWCARTVEHEPSLDLQPDSDRGAQIDHKMVTSTTCNFGTLLPFHSFHVQQ